MASNTAAPLDQQTYLPGETPAQQVADVHDFLSRHEERRGHLPAARYFLAGAEAHDQVELPPEVHRLLVQVVSALQAGRAVTVAPQNTTLTTQQAADLLNVSRPTLVKLLEDGQIPFERIDHRRKVFLDDVLAYREVRRNAQHDAVAALSLPIDDEDAAAVLHDLKEARRAVAERRRTARTSQLGG